MTRAGDDVNRQHCIIARDDLERLAENVRDNSELGQRIQFALDNAFTITWGDDDD